MAKGNPHFNELKREYVFPIIEQKLAELQASKSPLSILNLGIGDVSLPLASSVCNAIQQAALEMSQPGKIYGYGPSQGYLFLRNAICSAHYPFLSPEEIFISDGINTDIVNILDLFDPACKVAIPDPAYPAYLDSNLIAGRKDQVVWMPCTEESGFVPSPPLETVDLVYLCSPHNPTGTAMNRKQLESFVAYAHEHDALLLYDNAYEAFITSPEIPKSIYEIPGAIDVAMEFRSFSKSAGFTGLRCSYLVLPKKLTALFEHSRQRLHGLWMKRQSIKFNGVSYPIQKGAEACFSPAAQQEIQSQVAHYLQQAGRLKKGLTDLGFRCFGGTDAPYIWWETPDQMSSWDFFDLLLKTCHLICVPGSGFGKHGQGFVRLSSFISEETAQKALEKIQLLSSSFTKGNYAILPS